MNAVSLRAMGRPALQKLAKENGIKANLKTDVIIELLLERLVHRSPSPQPCKNKRSPLSPRPSMSKATANLLPELSAALVRSSPPPNNSTNPIDAGHAAISGSDRHLNDPTTASPLPDQIGTPNLENMELQYPSSPAYTFGTPESSMPGTPEPEAPSDVLKEVVDTMAHIKEQDRKTFDEIAMLRDVASKLRSKAEALRAGIRAERARRQRVEKYTAYWRMIPSEWSFKDVWEAQIRIYRDSVNEFEVTTSDDEPITLQLEEFARQDAELRANESEEFVGDIILTLPSNARIALESLRKHIIRGAVEAASPVVEAFGMKQNGKRSRENLESSEDEARYQRRARSEEPEANLPPISEGSEPLADLPRGLINGGALEISVQPAAMDKKKGGKRRREDAENLDESVRYRTRPRLADEPSSKESMPPSFATQSRMDKGKGKMTPGQVEQLLKENAGRWKLHAQDSGDSPPMPTELREIQVKYDRDMAVRMQQEEYSSRPPTDALAVSSTAAEPALLKASSPSKPTRRSTRAASKRVR